MATSDKTPGLAHGAWGIDNGTYHITGEMHAVAFKVQDDTTNLWNKTNHTIDVLGAISHTAATTLALIATAGAVDITAGTNSTWTVGGQLDLKTTGGGDLLLTSTALGQTIVKSDNQEVKLQAPNNQINITAGTYIDLAPTGELQINGTAGVTGGGFTKGIKTSEADFDTSILDLHEMYG